jgi:hypothetical protein
MIIWHVEFYNNRKMQELLSEIVCLQPMKIYVDTKYM